MSSSYKVETGLYANLHSAVKPREEYASRSPSKCDKVERHGWVESRPQTHAHGLPSIPRPCHSLLASVINAKDCTAHRASTTCPAGGSRCSSATTPDLCSEACLPERLSPRRAVEAVPAAAGDDAGSLAAAYWRRMRECFPVPGRSDC